MLYAELYFTVLYSALLYFTILYYTILYYIMLYYTIISYNMLYYDIIWCDPAGCPTDLAIEIFPYYRCLWKNTSPEKNTRWKISFQSTKPRAGEQFLLLDCRARACAKGAFFFTDTGGIFQGLIFWDSPALEQFHPSETWTWLGLEITRRVLVEKLAVKEPHTRSLLRWTQASSSFYRVESPGIKGAPQTLWLWFRSVSYPLAWLPPLGWCTAIWRPISLLRSSLLRLVVSNFPGNPLWARELHPLELTFCLSQTLWNP